MEQSSALQLQLHLFHTLVSPFSSPFISFDYRLNTRVRATPEKALRDCGIIAKKTRHNRKACRNQPRNNRGKHMHHLPSLHRSHDPNSMLTWRSQTCALTLYRARRARAAAPMRIGAAVCTGAMLPLSPVASAPASDVASAPASVAEDAAELAPSVADEAAGCSVSQMLLKT